MLVINDMTLVDCYPVRLPPRSQYTHCIVSLIRGSEHDGFYMEVF